MRAKAIAEAEGRTLENRQNEDVIRRQMLAKVEAETTKAIKVVQEGMVYFGRGATELLSNPQQMTMLVGGLSVLAAGVYSSREGAKFGFKQLEKYLGQPSLIRETSRGAFWKPQSAGANILGDVQLEKSMETRVKQLATATARYQSEEGTVQKHLAVWTTGDRENDGSETISETLWFGLRFNDWRGRGAVRGVRRDENSRDVRLGRHLAQRFVVIHRRSGCVFSEKRWERRLARDQIGVKRVVV